MIPSTPEELREIPRGWALADLSKGIRAALPELEAGMEVLISD